MRTHRAGSHAPAEMRRGSDLTHRVEGVLLLVIAVLAIARNVFGTAWASIAWPGLVLVAGLLLLLAIYPTHPVGDWPLIWRDPQPRQHTIIALALIAAGAAEFFRSSPASLGLAWPGALAVIGVLFLTHAQHGTGQGVQEAVRRHRFLGATLILAGLIAAVAAWTSNAALVVLWPVVLLAAAAQLLVYREPEGAYETPHAGHDGGSAPTK